MEPQTQVKVDATITGENIKTFIRLLQCAAKFGDDVHMHVNKDAWEISVTNSSKSAFCLFKLDKSFFYDRKKWDDRTLRRGVKCSLHVKSMLAVLGKLSQINNVLRLDLIIKDSRDELRATTKRKSVTTNGYTTDESSQRRFGEEDEYEEEDDLKPGLTATLLMKLVCKHGVIKRHTLNLASSDFLRANVDPDTTPSGFQVSARTLRDWLDHFSITLSSSYNRDNVAVGLNQLGWMFTPDEVRVKSWEGGSSGLSTEIKVDQAEFEDYEVHSGRVDLALPMKEFKATLMLAEQLNINLSVAFSEATQPLTLTSFEDELDDCSILCVIATTSCDAFSDVPLNIKRSGSTTTGSGAPHDHREGSGTGRKRRASETPSQGRKRSSLSFSRGPENENPMVNIFVANRNMSSSQPTPARNASYVKNSVSGESSSQHLSGGDLGQCNDNETTSPPPRRRGDQESLFFPGASQTREDEQELEGDGHEKSLGHTIQASLKQVLSQAGLGELEELHDELDKADEEDEEEFRASQMQQVAEEMDVDGEHHGVPGADGQRSPSKWATDNELEEEDDKLEWDTRMDQIQDQEQIHVDSKGDEEVDELEEDNWEMSQVDENGKPFEPLLDD